jgi:16S rRNA (uracil1498-N3)-methyltransferase
VAPPRVYTTQPLAPDLLIELDQGARQHLTRALRMSAGDALVLFNGDGLCYPAELMVVDKKSVTARVNDRVDTDVESPLAIHLGIAISRGERMDWVVQKATELGVTTISPLNSDRSGVKLPGERADRKLRHWQQIAISACEQCGRNRIPIIARPAVLSTWLATVTAELRLVLHHRAEPSPAHPTPGSVALLVGPEGGLSPGEIAAAEQADFTALALGPRVLRTETAPLAALAILQARWGDM